MNRRARVPRRDSPTLRAGRARAPRPLRSRPTTRVEQGVLGAVERLARRLTMQR